MENSKDILSGKLNTDNSISVSQLLSRIDFLSSELQKYKAVFAGSLDLILIIDGTDGTILEVNDAFKNALGYEISELKGRPFSDLFPEQTKTIDNMQMFGPVLSSRRVRHSNGSFIPMDITINVINVDNSKAVLIILRDASERVMSENKLNKLNEELAVLNSTKDKFFSIIAHDLRNPLGGILGLSEMLTSDEYELSQEEIHTVTTQINSSAIRLNNLLNNLLDWAWLQTGNIVVKPEKLNLDLIIEEIVQLLQANAISKNISLSFSEKSGSVIFADCNMIKSVIQNLLSNALKFTNEKGSVKIAVRENDGYAKIAISDTGVGIPESRMKKLFRIGEQVSTPGTGKETGTGLGLLLCKELVKKNGGTISVKSEEGNGTIFSVSFAVVTS
jgi:PAS domain S-box-containing protein